MNKYSLHKRLWMARRMRGLSMDELVKLMNGAISKQSISKYERGVSSPRPHHLQLLMTALGITEEYFNRETVKFTNINYRCKGDISDSQKEHIECRIREKVERYLEIENSLNIYPEFKNPLSRIKATTLSDIEKSASLLRDKWQLGTHPIYSISHLLETYGIMVVEMGIDCTELLGFSAIIDNKRPVIVINIKANQTIERQRFTMLHELCHILIFIKNMAESLELDEERLCERFAGTFLCPNSILTRELGEKRTTFALDELISIRERYGISIAAIVHCCKDIGIITEQYYNYVYDNYINKNKLETGWGEYPIKEHTNRFSRLIQRAIAEGIITQNEIAEIEIGAISINDKNRIVWD